MCQWIDQGVSCMCLGVNNHFLHYFYVSNLTFLKRDLKLQHMIWVQTADLLGFENIKSQNCSLKCFMDWNIDLHVKEF